MSAAALPSETRALIGDLAEKLLDAGNAILMLLDVLDGDADCEDDGTADTEPAL